MPKFIIAFDTICDGWQTSRDEETNEPVLYDTKDDAIVEMFDDAFLMLEHKEEDELNNIGISLSDFEKMTDLYNHGTIEQKMELWEQHPELNYNNEFIVPENEYIDGRKAIFGAEGLKIVGN